MINTNVMIECKHLSNENIDDVEGLLDLCYEAESFIQSFPWCKRAKTTYYDRGFRHAAIFLCQIEPARKADPEVWVIVGDLPPAVIDTSCKNGAEALAIYCWWLDKWASAVEKGLSVEDYMPILTREGYDPLSPTQEFADMVRSRSSFLKRTLLYSSIEEFSDEFKKDHASVVRMVENGIRG